MDQRIVRGNVETSDDTHSQTEIEGMTGQVDTGKKSDGLKNDAVRKKYGHLCSRAAIFSLINRKISPDEAEILLLDLEIKTRKELRHNMGLEVCDKKVLFYSD